jgi:hypothetical protein
MFPPRGSQLRQLPLFDNLAHAPASVQVRASKRVDLLLSHPQLIPVARPDEVAEHADGFVDRAVLRLTDTPF